MRNLWRAFKLVLPHRWMLTWYLCTALGLAICGSAPLILAHTFIAKLESAGKLPAGNKRPNAEEIKKQEADALIPGAQPRTGAKHFVKNFFENFDRELEARFGTGRDYVLALCGMILFFWALKATLDFLNTYIGSWLAQRLRTEAIERVMAKLLSLDMPYFDKQSTGDLVSRMVSDGEHLRKTVKIFLDFAQQPFLVIALVSVAVYYDWRLFLIGAIGVPLLIFPLVGLIRKITKQAKRYQEKTADIAQEMIQNLSGIRVIHAYGAEELEAKGFKRLTGSLFKTGMKRSFNRAIQRPLTSVLMGLGGVAVMAYGGVRIVEKHQESAADFVTFLGALGMLYDPITAIMLTLGEIAEYLPSAERTFEILDVVPQICDAPNAGVCLPLSREIVFEKVDFNYGSGAVLRDFNLVLKRGEKLGIVGRTGVGKSTLLSLLLRFYEPTAGRILIDGVDIRSVTLASLRSQIALVTQQPFLFHASVEDNIRYGRPNATDAEIVEAAKTAMIHDEIMSKPLGYKELCGERGGELFSGGQKQRIAVARALLRNAPILLLDEATSALDSLKERTLQDAFDKLEADRTCLIVAHRLSTLDNADRIMVFGDEGGVEAIGKHAELMLSSPTYRKMWLAQNARASDE